MVNELYQTDLAEVRVSCTLLHETNADIMFRDSRASLPTKDSFFARDPVPADEFKGESLFLRAMIVGDRVNRI